MMSALTRFLPLERRALMADALLLATAAGGSALALLTLLAEEVQRLTDGTSRCPWPLCSRSCSSCPAGRLAPAWSSRVGRRTVPGVVVGLLLGGLVVWALVLLVAGLSILVAGSLGDTVSAGQWPCSSRVPCACRWPSSVARRRRPARPARVAPPRRASTWAASPRRSSPRRPAPVSRVWVVLNPGQDPAELLAFGLAMGVVGATVGLGADTTCGTLAPAPKAPTS